MHFCAVDSTLKEAGLRNTRDRHDILALFEQDRAWSVAQLHEELKRMNLSTVYRNVQALLAEHLLVELETHAGEAFYERAGRTHHDHTICTQCHKASCIPCPIIQIRDHRLELEVRCQSCV